MIEHMPAVSETEDSSEVPEQTSGTPKKGVNCGTCDDWGTVVVGTSGSPREVRCPMGCTAAVRILKQRGLEWQ